MPHLDTTVEAQRSSLRKEVEPVLTILTSSLSRVGLQRPQACLRGGLVALPGHRSWLGKCQSCGGPYSSLRQGLGLGLNFKPCCVQ